MATNAGVRAGRAFVEIFAKDMTGAVLKNIEGKLSRFGRRLQSIGFQVTRVGLAALAPSVLSLRRFAEFDDSMRKVQARSKGSADDMQAVRAQAKELGRTTAMTASQVGELQAKLAQMGFSRKQIVGITEDVLNLALAAGESGRESGTTASALLAGTLRAFQMDITEAARVSDVLTATVNNSNFSLDELLTSMKNAGPIAKRFNASLEETVAILALMRNMNIDASMAGTALRNMYQRLSKSSGVEDFNEQLKALTGRTVDFTDAAGNLVSVPEALDRIGKAFKGLGTAQQADVLNTLFGLRAVSPAGASVANLDKFMELFQEIRHSSGLAGETRRTRESGIGGAFRRALSATEGLQLAVGEALEKSVDKGVDAFLNFIKILTDFVNKNQEAVASFFKWTAALVATGASLVLLGTAVRVLSFGFKALSIVWSVAMLVGNLLMMTISGLVMVMTALWGVLTMGVPFAGAIVAAFAALGASLILFQDTVKHLKAILQGFLDTLGSLGTMAGSALSSLGEIVQEKLQATGEAAKEIASEIGDFWGQRFSEMKTVTETTVSKIKEALSQGDFVTAWKAGVMGLSLVWDLFLEGLQTSWEEMWFTLEAGWLSFRKKFEKQAEETAGIVNDAFAFLNIGGAGSERSRTDRLNAAIEASRRRHGIEGRDLLTADESEQKDIEAFFGKRTEEIEKKEAELGKRMAETAKQRRMRREALAKRLEDIRDLKPEEAAEQAIPKATLEPHGPDLKLGGGVLGGFSLKKAVEGMIEGRKDARPEALQALVRGSMAAEQAALENQMVEQENHLAELVVLAGNVDTLLQGISDWFSGREGGQGI